MAPAPPTNPTRHGRSHHHHHHHRVPHIPHSPFTQHYWSSSEVSCCVKYMVFGFNIIFWIVGTAVLLTGVYAQIEKNPFSQLGTQLAKFYLDPAWFLVIVGGVTFIIGTSGCIGALRENTFLLAVYAVLVGILLLTELIVGILGFVFKDWVKQQLELELNSMIQSYRQDPDLQSIIDWIQADWLHCCGIRGPNDWDMNIYFNKSSEALGSPEAGGVPFSCCASEKDKPLKNLYCGHDVRKRDYHGGQEIYQTGCLDSGSDWINRNLIIVGSVAVAIAVIQILGICFAQNLRSDILSQRSRWEYEHRPS